MTQIIPISLREANEYVTNNHRHHKAVVGCKFCIALIDETSDIVGIAICGRPVSRYYDNGTTLEITRGGLNTYERE